MACEFSAPSHRHHTGSWGLRDYGVDGQLGLEPTPQEYIANMVDVFRLVRDVLADDGTLWLNIGDSYVGGGRGGNPDDSESHKQETNRGSLIAPSPTPFGLKPKDMVGMPWRLAFALQSDGWFLRSEIIFHKPNPMPESVNDRPTKSHEHVFLMSKRARYYYNADAITEEASPDTHARLAKNGNRPAGWADGASAHNAVAHQTAKTHRKTAQANQREVAGAAIDIGNRRHNCRVKSNESFDSAMATMPPRRNKRTVWTIPSEPFPDAHFAVFPTALVTPCILAGSHVGDIVLDPFLGSGTTAQVALSLGRHYIGCEINRDYVAMQAKRTAQRGLALGAA